MEQYDAVVVGSGHNALITAAYLARAGWSVLVLEGNDRPGGLVRTEELTRPGFLHDTYSAAHPLLVASPAYAELGSELIELGLEYRNTRYPTGASMPDGATAVWSTDAAENETEAERLACGDGAALALLLKELEPLSAPVFGLFAADLSTPSSAKVIHDLMHDGNGGYSAFAQLFTLTADERLANVGQPHFTAGLDAISRAVNEAARGLLPAEPTISFDMPSALDSSRCPPGTAVARLQMLDVPCRPRGDAAGEIKVTEGRWTEDIKNAFADRVIELATRHVPNLSDTILDYHVIAPDDLARFNPNCGPGDPYGGSHDLAQSYLFRPLLGQSSHRTIVPNLYMVGAATWPGHGVNGNSGYIVAKELLA